MIINGHKILNQEGQHFLVICGHCKSYTKKNKANLYRNKNCENCKDRKINIFSGRTISQWCWILGLNETTIRSRIQRKWTIKEALFQEKKEFIENLNIKDFKYISDFYSKSFDEDKKLEEKCNKKYDKLKIKY